MSLFANSASDGTSELQAQVRVVERVGLRRAAAEPEIGRRERGRGEDGPELRVRRRERLDLVCEESLAQRLDLAERGERALEALARTRVDAAHRVVLEQKPDQRERRAHDRAERREDLGAKAQPPHRWCSVAGPRVGAAVLARVRQGPLGGLQLELHLHRVALPRARSRG